MKKIAAERPKLRTHSEPRASCSDAELERINQAAEGLNKESIDVLDYQSIERLETAADAKKRGRGRPRHTS
jgi:hypothetical protein